MLTFLMVCVALLNGCGIKINELPKKRFERIRIEDPSEMYGSFVFSKIDSIQLLEQIRKPAMVNKIIAEANERFWPPAMNNLDARLSQRQQMYRYKVYRVANIGIRTILAVPPEKNKHMPAPFQSTNTFFVIMNISATKTE
ncbi:MAG: hypothetical protein ACO3BD_07185 [Chitinophagaceae bacterium]